MDVDEKESLDQFIAAEQERLERFRKFWLEGMQKQPDIFPAELEPGEWDEQYRCAEGG